MPVNVACIAGERIYSQWKAGRFSAEQIGPRETPFGKSSEIFLVQQEGQTFYLLPRHGLGLAKPAPSMVNYRANLYALKDLGVESVVAWGPGGAITHSIAVGDLVILSDVIDRTYLRKKTFFEDSPLGYLRQFPVFCPTLRQWIGEALHEMKLVYHGDGTAAVNEGPRLETPAEVRMLAGMGVAVVTHTFVPEVFLAKELEMCYAAVCYVVNYAETGSRHRPFAAGGLFGGLSDQTELERLTGATEALTRMACYIAEAVANNPKSCQCHKTMARWVEQFNLPPDFRKWFD